jgi:hypothetical protein
MPPGTKLSDERPFPLHLTLSERITLEIIRDGREPPGAVLETVLKRGWAKRSMGVLAVTPAGEKALADDDAARTERAAAEAVRKRSIHERTGSRTILIRIKAESLDSEQIGTPTKGYRSILLA